MVFDEIVKHHEFYKGVNNADPTPFLAHLNNGVFYGYKRDIGMRPLIVINVRRLIDTEMEVDQLVSMGDFFLTYLLKYGMAPGRVESWTVIFDLGGVGVTELPKNQLQGIV